MCYISRCMRIVIVSNGWSDLHGYSRSWYCCHSTGHVRFPISNFTAGLKPTCFTNFHRRLHPLPGLTPRTIIGTVSSELGFCYTHMPIGKVWIYRLLFVCFLCVYTVTDFFDDRPNKANGVKFCTVVHRHHGQGISHFGELCSQEAQNRTNRPATGK